MKEQRMRTAVTVLIWLAVAAGAVAAWYCFGGYAFLYSKITMGDETTLDEGLSTFFTQLFLVFAGVAEGLLLIIKLVCAIGLTVAAARKKTGGTGFLYAGFIPCPVGALVHVFCAVAGTGVHIGVTAAFAVFAALEIALFVTGIISAVLRKKAAAQPAV